MTPMIGQSLKEKIHQAFYWRVITNNGRWRSVRLIRTRLYQCVKTRILCIHEYLCTMIKNEQEFFKQLQEGTRILMHFWKSNQLFFGVEFHDLRCLFWVFSHSRVTLQPFTPSLEAWNSAHQVYCLKPCEFSLPQFVLYLDGRGAYEFKKIDPSVEEFGS